MYNRLILNKFKKNFSLLISHMVTVDRHNPHKQQPFPVSNTLTL